MTDILYGEPMEKWQHLKDLDVPEMVPLIVLGAAIFLGGIYPGPMLEMINGSVVELLTAIDML